MIVKDMINMLSKADLDSKVMLEVRDKDMNSIGYFEVGSDWVEYGGYSPDELDYFESINEPRSKAMVELTLNIDEWVKLGIVVEATEVEELGNVITPGDEIDGATLCDWCNMYFKGDGDLTRCNDCTEITFASEKKCGLYNIHYTFDAVGIERAESFLLEHVFKVKSVDELNQYQRDVFRSIELMEVCDCNE